MAKTKKDFYAAAEATGVELVLDADAEERTWYAYCDPGYVFDSTGCESNAGCKAARGIKVNWASFIEEIKVTKLNQGGE